MTTNDATAGRPTQTYDELSKEVRSIHKKIIWITISEICERLKDMYEPPDFRSTYTDHEDFTDEEIVKHDRLEKIQFAELRALKDCEGITYYDKVMSRYGPNALAVQSESYSSLYTINF